MSRGTLGMLGPLLGRNRRRIRVGIALAVVSQATLATMPLIQRVILDDTILSKRRSLGLWVGVLVAAGVVSFVGNWLRRSVSGTAAARSQRDLQMAVHHHMQHLDASRRDEFRSGDI